MRLPDTNVLVYAANAAASRWLTLAFEGPQGVALTWMALIGFVRLTTHPAILASPLTVGLALRAITDWCGAAGSSGNLTSDAHLAALAIEHGATVGTFDKDFRRFSGVRVDLLAV